jgi:hypothetical protein
MIRTPPAGKALIGLAGVGIDWRMLIIAPARQGGYYIMVASSDPDANLSRWTGSDMPVEQQDIATLVSTISDADWTSPAVEWHAIECAPMETPWTSLDRPPA